MNASPSPNRHNGGPPLDEEEVSPFGSSGYIKVGRDMRDHHLVGFGRSGTPADKSKRWCYSRAEAWQDLIMECRYKAGTVLNNGRPMVIERGQLLGAISWLANRWNWTPMAVRWFLDQLEAEGMIDRPLSVSKNKRGSDDILNNVKNNTSNNKPNNKPIGVISICNYELYQFVMRVQQQTSQQTQQQTNNTPTTDQQQTNNNTLIREEGKKGRKEEEKKEEKGEEASPPSASADTVQSDDVVQPGEPRKLPVEWQAFNLYNDLALRIGLPIARDMTPQRKKHLTNRLRENGGIDGWVAALANVERSAFLRGRNERGWKADIDFLLQASRLPRVIDGGYGNGAHADQGMPSQKPQDDYEEDAQMAFGRMSANSAEYRKAIADAEAAGPLSPTPPVYNDSRETPAQSRARRVERDVWLIRWYRQREAEAR